MTKLLSRRNNKILYLLIVIFLFACGDDTPVDESDNSEIINPGDYNIAIDVDTMTRWFKIIVPPGYKHTEPRPLLLAYHGGNLSMGFMYNNRKDIIERCKQENWILIFTNGANFDDNKGAATWNAIHCCNPAKRFNVDDVGYTREVISEVSKILKIDENRIYAIGGSNGAMFVHRLAAEMSDIFAAVAENQGTIGGKTDSLSPLTIVQPNQPIPFLLIHGMNDQKVKFLGGMSSTSSRIDVSFEESVLFWANHNMCNTESPDTTIIDGLNGKVWNVEFSDCSNNARVKGIAIENKGHGWPGLEESGFDGTNASIDFLKQFSK